MHVQDSTRGRLERSGHEERIDSVKRNNKHSGHHGVHYVLECLQMQAA